jgi:hypothetical protein
MSFIGPSQLAGIAGDDDNHQKSRDGSQQFHELFLFINAASHPFRISSFLNLSPASLF